MVILSGISLWSNRIKRTRKQPNTMQHFPRDEKHKTYISISLVRVCAQTQPTDTMCVYMLAYVHTCVQSYLCVWMCVRERERESDLQKCHCMMDHKPQQFLSLQSCVRKYINCQIKHINILGKIVTVIMNRQKITFTADCYIRITTKV